MSIYGSEELKAVIAYDDATDCGEAVELLVTLLEASSLRPYKLPISDLTGPVKDPEHVLVTSPILIVITLHPEGEISPDYSGLWHNWISRVPNKSRKLLLAFCDKGEEYVASVLNPFHGPMVFNPDDLLSLVGPSITLLKHSKKELAGNPLKYSSIEIPELTHSITSLRKVVTILPNGHGLTELVQKIFVTKEEVGSIPHHFGLNEYSPGKMKPLSELLTTDLLSRYSKPTFTYRP